jgi:hypothetical protein
LQNSVLRNSVSRNRFRGSALVGGAMAGVMIVLFLLPWAIRNQQVTGQMCWLTNRGGISLYDGVGPNATGASDLGSIKQSKPVRGLNETQWNQYFVDQSVRSIVDDPLRIAKLAIVKIARTWNPLPNADTYQSRLVRLVSVAWTIPVYGLAVFAVAMMWPRHKWSIIACLLPALSVVILHSLFVGSVRYRIVAMPGLEILAAMGISLMLDRRTGRLGRASASR